MKRLVIVPGQKTRRNYMRGGMACGRLKCKCREANNQHSYQKICLGKMRVRTIACISTRSLPVDNTAAYNGSRGKKYALK
jgi:hypothetical protein